MTKYFTTNDEQPISAFVKLYTHRNEFHFWYFSLAEKRLIKSSMDVESFLGYVFKGSYTEITENEAKKLEIKFSENQIELNEDYTAEVLKNGDVKVGCQTFKYDVIQKLAKVAAEKKAQ